MDHNIIVQWSFVDAKFKQRVEGENIYRRSVTSANPVSHAAASHREH
jgi:hypothetical protein